MAESLDLDRSHYAAVYERGTHVSAELDPGDASTDQDVRLDLPGHERHERVS